MDYTSKKRVLKEQFEANQKEINFHESEKQRLISLNLEINGRYKMIEDIEKEVMENNASPLNSQKKDKKKPSK